MFIKKVTKSLLLTQITSLKTEIEKIKAIAKEETKLNDKEKQFYHQQMTQIYAALNEANKQYDLITEGEKKNASKV